MRPLHLLGAIFLCGYMIWQFLAMTSTLFVDIIQRKKVKVVFDVIVTIGSLLLAIMFTIILIDTIIE